MEKGPCNKQRLDHHKKRHIEGKWVRVCKSRIPKNKKFSYKLKYILCQRIQTFGKFLFKVKWLAHKTCR